MIHRFDRLRIDPTTDGRYAKVLDVILNPAGRLSPVKYAQIGVIGHHGRPPDSTIPLTAPEKVTNSILWLKSWHRHARIVHLSLGTHGEVTLD